MATTPKFTSSNLLQSTTITTAQTINTKFTIVNSAATEQRIYSLGATTDATTPTVGLYFQQAGTAYPLTKIALTTSGGTTTAAAPVDLLGSTQLGAYVKQRDAQGIPFLALPIGVALQADYQTALTTKFITFNAQGEIF